MKTRQIQRIWRLALWGNVACIAWFWWQGASGIIGGGIDGALLAFGRLAGLAAAFTVLLQFVFMGRTPWLERAFGLDRLSRIHHTNGLVSFWLIVLHPILITFAYMRFSGLGLWEQIKSLLFEFEHVGLAAIGTGLFLTVVGLSITIVRQKLRYEFWYGVHLLVYLAVFLSFWHQIELGHDLIGRKVFYWYWITLYAVVLIAHVAFRIVRPLYISLRHRFTVGRIIRENHNAVSVYITGRDLGQFNIYPGQFMILRFLTRGRWWQAHPFSLSMAPNGRELRITVKDLGDFTRDIEHLPVGTRIIIDGPYGVFTEWVSVSPKYLFIAGGIGITPIRALFEKVIAAKKDAILLYSSKTEQDIVFRQELEAIAPDNVVHVISDEPQYRGEVGRVDEERIKRLVPDVRNRDVYVCGPAPMIEAVISSLHSIGVPSAQIHYEKFSLG